MCTYVGILSVASLMVGDAVGRIIDGNPSLCMSMSEDTVNDTNDTTVSILPPLILSCRLTTPTVLLQLILLLP